MGEREFDPADDVLAARGAAGDRAALADLYHRHRGRVFGYALRMTGDRDLADEVTADTFARLLAALPSYRPRGRFAAYLLRIARSRLAQERTARGRLAVVFPDAEDAGPPAVALPPDEAAAAAELAALARAALDRLPDHLREVVVLRLYEGLDYAAVGEVVGEKEATVRSRMRYALQALRRALPAAGGEPEQNPPGNSTKPRPGG